jgi:hypothetical protein
MSYLEFMQQKPVLFGSTMSGERQYIGSYETDFNKYSNRLDYCYVSEKGRMNKNMGFSLRHAFSLYQNGQLSLDPEKGKKENYL